MRISPYVLRVDRDHQGMTFLEVALVLIVIGILVAIAVPHLTRVQSRERTRSAVTAIAGMLRDARGRAMTDGVPYLVRFRRQGGGGGGSGSGGCAQGIFANVVRDNDTSYSLTPGDQVSDFQLPSAVGCDVAPYGEESGTSLLEDLSLPEDDESELAVAPSNSGPGSSSSGSGTALSNLTKGTSFPVNASGDPVIAFTPQGMPVDPAHPTQLASGAGAIYMTDNTGTVSAAILLPLGEVAVRSYDPARNDWK
jgi:prepilin-type N-terminal cleavage/methylation domain-containing protein